MKTALIKTRFFRLRAAALCLAVFAAAHAALADTELWVGNPGITATTNWSDPANWSGASQNPNDNAVFFGNANAVGPGIINNVVDKSTNCSSLNYTNFTGWNTTMIAAGQTLTIDGNTGNGGRALVMIPGHQAANTNLITGGDGALLITGASAGGVAVSVTNSSATGLAPILDMSGLGAFIISNTAGTAAMDVGASGSARAGGILKLARANYLSLPASGTGSSAALVVGYNGNNKAGAPGGVLYLGYTNSISADNIGVGIGFQNGATIAFNPAIILSGPTAFIRGYSGTAVQSWAIGDCLNFPGTSTVPAGTVNFNGGMVNAVVNAMWLGKPSADGTGSPTGTGTLSFNGGTMSVNVLTNGCAYAPIPGHSSGTGYGTNNVTGTGTLAVNSMVLAFAGGSSFSFGTLNITDATVAASTIIAGGGQSVINLAGGTLIVTNTAGVTGAPLTEFDLNDGSFGPGNLHLDVNGTANVTNIVATTFVPNFPTGLIIDSLTNVVAGGVYPLIAYSFGDPYGTLSSPLLPTGYSGHLADMPGSSLSLIVLIITAVPPTPVFSGLTSPSITYGTAGITLSGKVSATGPIYPAMGETVDVTIDGNEQATTIHDSTGDFSINYNPSTIPARGTPYSITYAYGGDANLLSASDTNTTLTVNQAVPVFSGLTASQSMLYGQSSITLSGKVSAPGPVYPAMGENIDVTIDGNQQMTTISDSTGDFSINYNSSTIPARGAPYPVTYAYGGDVNFASASEASTTLTVNAPPPMLSPAVGLAGSSATVSVSDYAPGETVDVTYNGVMITSFMVNGSGSGSMSFAIPPGQAETYPVVVTGQTSGLTATVYFQQINGPTTIDAANKYSWGANYGWMDWTGGSGQTDDGAIIGSYFCSGYIYSPNAGWIYLGGGSPANGINYQNNSTSDYGVNVDGLGNLTGYAYGANIGWINFEQTYGQPKVNLLTGAFSGYVWSANCGWISLSNADPFYLQTDTISPGALAPDGLPVAWLLTNFGTTNENANADPTGKGMTIAQDYIAGTDPNNANSIIQITGETLSSNGTSISITWASVPTRGYYIQKTASLTSAVWMDSGLGLISPSAGSTTTASVSVNNALVQFYRVQAVLPLAP